MIHGFKPPFTWILWMLVKLNLWIYHDPLLVVIIGTSNYYYSTCRKLWMLVISHGYIPLLAIFPFMDMNHYPPPFVDMKCHLWTINFVDI